MCGISSIQIPYGFSSESMDSETALASKGDIREQPKVTQARFPLFNRRTMSGEEIFVPSLPATSRPSATVNPHGYPACLRLGAPDRAVHGPGLNRDMLTSPRCSKSRLHRQRVGAKFSHSLYRPLPSHCWPDAVSCSRGHHRLPSGPPIPVSTCRAARPTCFILTTALLRASRYPVGEGGCALLPRHHSEPKELLLVDHFDATPQGVTLVTPRPPRVSARGASPRGWAFHLLRENGRLEPPFPSLSSRDFTARSPLRRRS